MSILLRLATVILACLFPVTAMSWFGPSSYEDCILKNMRGVTSDVAAAQIRNACREKFRDRGPPVPKSRALRADELAKLTGRAKLVEAGELGSFLALLHDPKEGSIFSGTLHNGNAGLEITEVVFILSSQNGTNVKSQAYSASISLAPLSAGEFKIRVSPGEFKEGFTWAIQSARGF